MKPWYRRILWITGAALLIVAVFFVAVAYWMDEPLRAFFERRMNQNLKGYRVTLARLDFDPLGPSLQLKQLIIRQTDHPEPPVAFFKAMNLGIHWRALLRGRLVGHVHIQQPELYINLTQLRAETRSRVEVENRGWQQALQSIYPLKINLFTVEKGALTYIDEDPRRPLRIRGIALNATNIRNVVSPEKVYPSPFTMQAVLFDYGRLDIAGRADFLAEPVPGIKAEIHIDGVPLPQLAPVLKRHHLSLESGRLSADGQVEYAPGIRRVYLRQLRLYELNANFLHSPASEKIERKAMREGQKAAQAISKKDPGVDLRIDLVDVRGEVGMINTAATPAYRVFLQNLNLRLENFSSGFSKAPAQLKLTCAFMGSGAAVVEGTFRSEENGPDFDLNVKIEGTQLTDMNNLLKAYGNFDVVAGTFSLFTELQVHNDKIDGYVKPFFKDIEVYDRRQDEEKNIFRQMYEGLVGGLSALLSRDPQERVATRTDLSGNVQNPQANTWQLIVTLVRNAFFKAVLPGFDEEISTDKKATD